MRAGFFISSMGSGGELFLYLKGGNSGHFPSLKGEGMSEILEEIDSWMRHIWLEIVKEEYEQSRILKESNLHYTVYFHLRKVDRQFEN